MFQRYLPLIGLWILYLENSRTRLCYACSRCSMALSVFRIFSFFLVCPILLFFFPLFLRRLYIDHDTIQKSRVTCKPKTTVQTLQTCQIQSRFLPGLTSYTGAGYIWWWLGEGEVGGGGKWGRSRMRLIECR